MTWPDLVREEFLSGLDCSICCIIILFSHSFHLGRADYLPLTAEKNGLWGREGETTVPGETWLWQKCLLLERRV